MAVEFTCTQCQSELRIEDQDAAKKTRCPRCGMIQMAPQSAIPSQTTQSESSVPEKSEPAAKEPDSTKDDPANQETIYRPQTETGEVYSIDGNETERSAEPNARWFMKTSDGTVYGPVPRNELDEWATEGRVSAACLLREQSQNHWQSAISVYPELAGLKPHQTRNRKYSATTTQSVPEPANSYQPVSQSSVRLTGRTRVDRPNSGCAILIVALLGLFMPYIPVFSPIALIWALKERKAINAGDVSSDSSGILDIATIVALLGCILIGVGVLGCMSFFF